MLQVLYNNYLQIS